MKTIKKIYIIIVAFLAIGLYSCDDMLDTVPQDFNTITNFYKTDGEILSALASCYAPLANHYIYGGYLTFEALVDDLTYSRVIAADIVNRPSGWNYTSSNTIIRRMWNMQYLGIERTNNLLKYIDGAKMDSLLRETYRQEARFLRAHYHFLLNNYWGDIPLRTQMIDNPGDVNRPRTPTDSVMRFVIREMEEVVASGALTKATAYTHAARITQTAAQSILARVYMKAAGFPLNWGAPMYQKALNHALAVKNANIHKLHPDFAQLFINQAADEYDAVNRESIWEAEFVGNGAAGDIGRSSEWTSRLGTYIGIQSNHDQPAGYGYSYGQHRGRLKLHDLYNKDVNDTRKARSLGSFSINASGAQVNIANVGEWTAAKWRRGDEKLFPKVKNWTSTNMSIIRYADVLLMIAEAENELNGPTAIAHNALNEVRTRAGAINFTSDNGNNFLSKDDFRQEIMDERARELCFEGVRKMDLVRWGIFVSEMQLATNQALNDVRSTSSSARRDLMVEVASRMTEKYILFPIPQAELKLNNKMTQNPFW